MTIPMISPYSLPVESEFPENRVAWKPDPDRAILLIHDMQEYFLDFFDVNASPISESLQHMKQIRKQCSELGIPVVYTAQPSEQTPEQRGLLQDFWGSGLNEHPQKKKIVDELFPQDQDIVLTKWRYSAFQRTNFLKIFQEQGRDQLIICGIYAHIGCLQTACEAFMQDIQVFFIADAMADFSLSEHKMALNYAAQRCAMTLSTQQLMNELQVYAKEEQSESFTLDCVREEVAKLLQRPATEIDDHDNLIYLGLDSIRIMSLVELWRCAGVEVTFVELAEQPTLAGWWNILKDQQLKGQESTFPIKDQESIFPIKDQQPKLGARSNA